MIKNNSYGHFFAALTIVIWATTFVSTKILLVSFAPIEILVFRFLIGLAALFAIYPKFLKFQGLKTEVLLTGAGLCGICLYYLLENIALTYTSASNVGIIVAAAPFFTAIFSKMFLDKKEKLGFTFVIGFILAMAGIITISFKNNNSIQINPFGDLLALGAAVVWALYSVLSKKITALELNTFQATRRTFLYGLIFMIPFSFIFKYKPDYTLIINKNNIFNLLYLGLGASALCFVTWNIAVKKLGAVKTGVYIYMVPVITIIASAIVLKEKITPALVAGALLTLTGLIVSELKITKGKKQ